MKLTQTQTILMWTLSVLLAALFLFAGIQKLIGAPQVVEGFRQFGFPAWFRYLIGFIETVGAIGLLIPKIAAETGSFMIIVMLGALFTVLHAGGGFSTVFPALAALFMLGGVTTLRGEQ